MPQMDAVFGFSWSKLLKPHSAVRFYTHADIISSMLVYSPRYLEHSLAQHPENNQRLKAIIRLLEEKKVFEKVPLLEPAQAREEDILRAHAKEVLERVRSASLRGGTMLDPDTYVTRNSFEVAMLAAGGAITGVEKVLNGTSRYCFALVRPPGHHATKQRSMGFCLFNNVAVAAKYAVEKHALEKIFILDYDVHHGNGTQDIFYSSSQVLFASLHQYPFYPGTGSADEIGRGDGKGYTLNIPLPAGTGDADYLKAIDEIVLPVLKQFKPELMLVSAGYDAHVSDMIGGMNLSTSCYYRISELLKKNFGGGIVFSLEGGYNLDALAECVYAALAPLFGLEFEAEESKHEDKEISVYARKRIEEVKKELKDYWQL